MLFRSGGEHLADDEQRVAVEVVRGCARHDNCAGEVEAGEDDGEARAAPFVDRKADADAKERVDLSEVSLERGSRLKQTVPSLLLRPSGEG